MVIDRVALLEMAYTVHMIMKIGVWTMVAGIVFAFLPVLGVLLASGVATLGGCDLNEGSVNACVVLGMDMGGTLYVLFVMGWYALVTLPLGMGVAAIGLLLAIIGFIMRLFKKKPINETAGRP